MTYKKKFKDVTLALVGNNLYPLLSRVISVKTGIGLGIS